MASDGWNLSGTTLRMSANGTVVEPVPEDSPLPRLPRRRVMPEEERRLLERAAIVGIVLVGIIVALIAFAARFSH